MKTSLVFPLVGTTLSFLAGCRVEQHPIAYHPSPRVVYLAPAQPPPPPLPLATRTAPVPVGPAASAPVSQPIPATAAAAVNTPADVPPTPEQEQPEVLTRGPVHEAFAQPVALQSKQDCITASQPPATPQENAPAERPADAAYTWVPGYWSWDAERASYIWVSGCWRLPPPRMAWIPGYWLAISGGWQWVPGFWSPASAQEVVYLPAPPAVADIQPPGAAPSADEFWVPGCWYWNQGRYVFRAGYWLRSNPGWVWSPSSYAWTPRGHVFIEGHWDYALERRGVLFAPVYFPARIHTGVTFSFSPRVTLNIGLLTTSLFTSPRYTHYYFGDYYDDAYVRIGIHPWFDCVRIGTWYDPVFVYARWDHGRHNPRWESHLREEHTLRHDDRNRRPPRTYREQETRNAHLPVTERHEREMTHALTTAAPRSAIKLEQADRPTREKAQRQSEETRNFREARSRWEAAAPATPTTPVAKPAPVETDRRTTRTQHVRDEAPSRVTQPTTPVAKPAPVETDRRTTRTQHVRDEAPSRVTQPTTPETKPTPVETDRRTTRTQHVRDEAPSRVTQPATPETTTTPGRTSRSSDHAERAPGDGTAAETPATSRPPTSLQPDRVRIPPSLRAPATESGTPTRPSGREKSEKREKSKETEDSAERTHRRH